MLIDQHKPHLNEHVFDIQKNIRTSYVRLIKVVFQPGCRNIIKLLNSEDLPKLIFKVA